jgi:hypothetical protein
MEFFFTTRISADSGVDGRRWAVAEWAGPAADTTARRTGNLPATDVSGCVRTAACRFPRGRGEYRARRCLRLGFRRRKCSTQRPTRSFRPPRSVGWLCVLRSGPDIAAAIGSSSACVHAALYADAGVSPRHQVLLLFKKCIQISAGSGEYQPMSLRLHPPKMLTTLPAFLKPSARLSHKQKEP